jgi:flagellar biosynthesis protein FliR
MALKIDEREDIINAWVTIFMAAFMLSFPAIIYTFLHKN